MHVLLGQPLDGAGKWLSGMIKSRPDQVRDLVGLLPCEAFSRLTRATRRSQGWLPPPVRGFA